MEQEVLQSARRMGQRITQEQYNALHAAILADAEKKVRAGLLMAAIARKNEFKVTDEDIEKGLAELAEETGKNVAKLRVEYREKSKRDILIGMILEDKILDFIETKSNIKDGDPPKPEPKPEAAASSEPKGREEGRLTMTTKRPENRAQAMAVLESANASGFLVERHLDRQPHRRPHPACSSPTSSRRRTAASAAGASSTGSSRTASCFSTTRSTTCWPT